MPTILFNDNHIKKEDILEYRTLIQEILNDELRSPQIKKMVGFDYNNAPVFRAKKDRKNRLIFTYVQHEGQKTLLVLALNDHNYNKAKRQLRSKTTAPLAQMELKEKPDTESADIPKLPNLSFVPSIPFKNMTLALDESQQEGILLPAPGLLCGPPGAGKTVLLYNLMLRNIDAIATQMEGEKESLEKEKLSEHSLPVLFISQAEHSLNSLRDLYQETEESTKTPVLFTTWSNLLKAQNPGMQLTNEEHFAAWLKDKLEDEPANIVQYEFSLIAALGVEQYLKLGNRQCYYSEAPDKQKKIIALLEPWQHYLTSKNLLDPMVTALAPSKAKYSFTFCDEAQNLPPIALSYLIQNTQDQRFIGCLDSEQCLISSPYIHSCLKKLLHNHYKLHNLYKKYTEHSLPRTWRCPPPVAEAANHLMQEKYRLDGTGKRRGYSKIISAQESEGVVSWIDTKGLAKIHHHGASANTVVIAESVTPEEREYINKHLGTNNILSAKEAIGMDYQVVILWNPISQKKCLRDAYKKGQAQHDHLTLEQWNAFNALYVAITRAQVNVFIHEKETHLRTGCGTQLFGKLPLNEVGTFQSKCGEDQNISDWKERIEKHLADGKEELARELMSFHLRMNKEDIEKKIKSAKPPQSVLYLPAEINSYKKSAAAHSPRKASTHSESETEGEKQKKPPMLSRRRHRQAKAQQTSKTTSKNPANINRLLQTDQGNPLNDPQLIGSVNFFINQHHYEEVDKHIGAGEIDKARNIMRSKLKMNKQSIEEKIKSYSKDYKIKPPAPMIGTPIALSNRGRKTSYQQMTGNLKSDITDTNQLPLFKQENSSSQKIDKYIASFLKTINEANLLALFNHPNLLKIMFLHPLKEGGNLFTRLLNESEWSEAVMKLALQSTLVLNSLSTLITPELVCQPYSYLPQISPLTQLSSSETGITFLDKVSTQNTRFGKGISPDALLKTYKPDPKERYRYSPLFWFCNFSKGSLVLYKLMTQNPDLGKAITRKDLFLKIDDNQLFNPFHMLVRPSLGSIGRVILFNALLDINPALALQISAKDLCIFNSQEPHSYYNKPALYHLSTSHEGIRVLIKLLTNNPDLAAEIIKLRCESKPASEDSKYSYHIDDATYLLIIEILSSSPQGIEALKLLAGEDIEQTDKGEKKEISIAPAARPSRGGIFTQQAVDTDKTVLEKETGEEVIFIHKR